MKRSVKDIFFVGIQVVLFLLYLTRIKEIDVTIPYGLRIIGLLISVLGVLMMFSSVIALNRSLSAFPTPKQNAELVRTGLYKYIRHPIYTGILLFCVGYSLFSENTLRFIVFILLMILFRFKAGYEESLLRKKFSGYIDYMQNSGMFLPRLKSRK